MLFIEFNTLSVIRWYTNLNIPNTIRYTLQVSTVEYVASTVEYVNRKTRNVLY
jgi:hypothetical protein